jgi:hypothetical protein
MPVARKVWFLILVLMPASTARQPIMRYMSAWTHHDYAGVPASVVYRGRLLLTVSKPYQNAILSRNGTCL